MSGCPCFVVLGNFAQAFAQRLSTQEHASTDRHRSPVRLVVVRPKKRDTEQRLSTRISIMLGAATVQGWTVSSHVLFPGRFVNVQLESRQSTAPLCIISNTLWPMWKRRPGYASCDIVKAAYAVDRSSLEVVILSLLIAKKGLAIYTRNT